jgi:hypothetical protein
VPFPLGFLAGSLAAALTSLVSGKGRGSDKTIDGQPPGARIGIGHKGAVDRTRMRRVPAVHGHSVEYALRSRDLLEECGVAVDVHNSWPVRAGALGYEYLDESRRPIYSRVLEAECAGLDCPAAEYINGDTRIFEQIARAEGVFNRMLIYRRNSLHSGAIERAFVPDANARTGRLSINSFIDPDASGSAMFP